MYKKRFVGKKIIDTAGEIIMPETHFAKAQRSSKDQLNEEIRIITESPLIDNLMTTIGGLLAVLDENRQIVAINQTMLKMLGITNIDEVLGSRTGEAFNCIHSSELPNGCGTTKSCRTCGAVLAIISSLELNEPVEQICIAEVIKNGESDNLYLGVRAAPIILSTHRFVLLFLQDLSAQQKLSTLEKVFFHDINNILTGLLGYSEIMTRQSSGETLETAQCVKRGVLNLCREVALQRIISHGEIKNFQLSKEDISVNAIINETCDNLRPHSSTHNKTFTISSLTPDKTISSDYHLIVKILTNMLLNAFEASAEGEQVRIWAENTPEDKTIFAVWNKSAIPSDIRHRVFQKNFSTKNKPGRGLGTYSTKIFGEEILKGEVSFSSSTEIGTTFYFKI